MRIDWQLWYSQLLTFLKILKNRSYLTRLLLFSCQAVLLAGRPEYYILVGVLCLLAVSVEGWGSKVQGSGMLLTAVGC